MRTKKYIKDKHNKTNKINKIAKTFESEDRSHKSFVPHFDVKYISDAGGWYQKLTLKAAKDGSWSDDLVGKPVVTLESFDGDLVLNLKYNHNNYKLEFPLFVLHDIAVAASILNEFGDGHVFTKVKMKKKK